MDALSVLCVVAGVLIVASRGPLVFAPEATLRVYERMLATDARVRAVGAFAGALAVATLTTPAAGPLSRFWLGLIGAMLLGVTIWLIAAPAHYRRMAHAVFDFARGSTDGAIVRGVGLLAVAIGACLIYVGLRAV